MSQERINDAIRLLSELDFPRAQLNDRTALCLLALLGLAPDRDWSDAQSPLVGITPIMAFARERYGRDYAPNSRETFRRFSMHQFVGGGLALYNPDEPSRPVNSPKAVYQIVPEALDLIRTFGARGWEGRRDAYLAERQSLVAKYAKARELERVPVAIPGEGAILLSPGAHSLLIRQVIEEYGSRFAPGSRLLYAGDTGDKWVGFDHAGLRPLGVDVDSHGKMPDVVLYDGRCNRLILIEAAVSHGPVDGKRHGELSELFGNATAELELVSAFPDRKAMQKYTKDLAWGSKVWLADEPSHLVSWD